jgi:hypothetical protein
MTRQHTFSSGIRTTLALTAIVLTILTVFAQGQQTDAQQPFAGRPDKLPPGTQDRIADNYGKLPLSFEVNQGQSDPQVKFLSGGSGYSLFLTGDEAVLTLRGSKPESNKETISGANHALPPGGSKAGGALRMKLRNANSAARVTGMDQLPGTSNYFVGNDPAKWRTNVPTYAKVKYESIYSGIDLIYYGNQRQLEYDFIVSPGADVHRILFDVLGVRRVRRDEHGDLVLRMAEGEIRWHKPAVYQEKDGVRQEVAAHYAITDKNRVGFVVSRYDTSRTLYIDPIIYSTYLGGSTFDFGNAIAVDGAGNAYVTGSAASANFPTTPGAFQTVCRSCPSPEAFITKLNPTGSALVYSTYLGGSGNDFGGDRGNSIAVDSAGNAYVTGVTQSSNFPVTRGAFQKTFPGGPFGSGFVTELDPTGAALVYSTYLGGNASTYSESTAGTAIAVDSAGYAYVTGTTSSTNFPTTPGAFQTTLNGFSNAFVTKFNHTGSALVYSTYLAGSGGPITGDAGQGIAVDSAGNAYVTGATGSANFPTTPGAFQTTCGNSCGGNAFVTKFNSTGSALIYSTYLGGSGTAGSGIAVGSSGDAFVTGLTLSTDFPVTPGAFQTTCGGCGFTAGDAFVARVNSSGSALVYSTYLGGNNSDWGASIAVDGAGNAYVTGVTASTNFPTMDPLQPTNEGGLGSNEAFVAKLSPGGSALVYSTYLGANGNDSGSGIAVDSSGSAYVTGNTHSANFPTTYPLQPFLLGGTNAFVAKISAEPSNVTLFPLHLNFVGQSVDFVGSPQASTLMNAGSDALAITSISIIGTNSRDFAQTNNCGTSVPPGTSCSITVTFTPKASGSRSASVSIAAPDSPLSLSLTGFGRFVTSTTISSSLNPSLHGQAVTFTATVSSPGGPLPYGEEGVSFFQNSDHLGSATLYSAAALTTPLAYPGLHTITAVYAGDGKFDGSTSPGLRQAVDTENQFPTSTVLVSNLNPSAYGQEVTLTATVSTSGSTNPTGKVNFTGVNHSLGAAMVNASGVATLSRSNLNADLYPVTAVYVGDADNGPSASNTFTQVIAEATSAATLTSSPNPSSFGQAITFTATITSATVKPTGPVTFTAGKTVLGTAQLNGEKATFTTSTLPVGSTTVTATYSGDSNIAGSSASVTQVVQ